MKPPLLIPLLLLLLLGGTMGTRAILAQTVEFTDGKSLPLANEANLLRIRELVRDQNWMAAARQAIEVIEAADPRLYELETQRRCRLFVDGITRTQFLIAGWASTAPQALEAYRQLVDAEAEALLQRAIQQQDLKLLKQVATRFFASRAGGRATDQLARIEFEQGHFLSAATRWDSLIDQPRFPGTSILRFPDSSLPPTDLMTDSLAASLLAGDYKTADDKLRFLTENFAAARFDFLGRQDLGLEELKQWIAQEKETLREREAGGESTWVDIQGRAAWQVDLEVQLKDRSPFYGLVPAVAEPDDAALATFVTLDEHFFYWCDAHRIYRKPRRSSGDPQPVKQDQVIESQSEASSFHDGQPATDVRTLWSTFFRRELLPTARKEIGRPVFEVEIDSGLLFARMGNPRTSYRNDTITRNRTYLVGLDLTNEAALLPGFPLENEDPRVEFDATPVHYRGKLFVSRRRTFRDNATNQLTIQCLELSPSNRVDEPRLIWERQLVSAESNNRGIWDEIARTQLIRVENRLIHVGLGFVTAFDLANGDVLWVTDYYRDRFEFARENGRNSDHSLAAVRARDQILVDRGRLFVAPTDSTQIFCLDLLDGRCHWSVRFPRVAHLLGVVEGHLLASGHHLLWIDAATGRLQARFPSVPAESGPGYGLSESRGMGKGTIDRGHVYWPTRDEVFVLRAALNPRQEPVLSRRIDIRLRNTTGGNLTVGTGIMLIANEREIKAYVD